MNMVTMMTMKTMMTMMTKLNKEVGNHGQVTRIFRVSGSKYVILMFISQVEEMVVQMVNNINLGNNSYSGGRKDGKGTEERERVEADENLNKEGVEVKKETEPDLPVGKSVVFHFTSEFREKKKLVASGKEKTSDKSEESWRHSWSCCR